MNNYCVYELFFPNGKRYIGITGKKPESRWKKGKGYLGQKVYRAIEKYGWDNIQHNILYDNLNKEEACKIERELIKRYNTLDCSCGYNFSEGGDCGSCMSGNRHWTYSVPRPENTREKISNSLMGRYVGKDNPHHTSVRQLQLNGSCIKTWDSIADIQRELGYGHAHIIDCCKGRRSRAYGYKWEYSQKKKL